MSFDLETSPTEPVIVARSLGKSYRLFESPGDRLKQLLWGRWKQYSREFQALKDVNFEIYRPDWSQWGGKVHLVADGLCHSDAELR